jgi:hypothetical protein
MVHLIHIEATRAQINKLKKGGKIRTKKAIQGQGFNLIVDPSTFDILSRTFSRGNNISLQLSPQEIAANEEAEPDMQGSGIFGHKFDNYLEKKGVKKLAYKIGDALKPGLKAGILGGLAAGSTALAGTELIASGGLGAGAIPLIYGTAGSLGVLANDYIDNPKKYQTNVGGPINKISAHNLQGQTETNKLLNYLSTETGQKYNALSEAALGNAMAEMDRSQFMAANTDSLKNTFNASPNTTDTPHKIKLNVSPNTTNTAFKVKTSGAGLRHKVSRGKREVSSITHKGTFVGGSIFMHPAMKSQPFSANFQFRHTLPPAYQNKGSGLY